MKTLTQRALSLLLAALLLFSALPTATAAEDNFIEDPAAEEITGEPVEELTEETAEESVSEPTEESTEDLPEEAEEFALLSTDRATARSSQGEVTCGETEPFVYVNPIYADVVTEADILAATQTEGTHSISAVETYAAESETVYNSSTEEAAAAQLRQSFAAWESTAIIKYYSATALHESFVDEEDGNTKYRLNDAGIATIKRLYRLAIDYTGVCNEGDYLLYEQGGYGANTGWSGNSSGWTYSITYTPNAYSTRAQEMELSEKADEILTELNLTGLSDYEKIRLIHQYLVDHVTYDNANLADNTYKLKYTAYAALVNNTAVCQGYSCAFYRLALAAGVETRIIGSTAMCHAWNVTLLNGTPYMLDSTWDAGKAETNWRYFLRGTTYWSANHKYNSYSDLGDEFLTGGKLVGVYTLPEEDFSAPTWTLFYDANGGTGAPAAQAFTATPKTSGTNLLYQAQAAATVSTDLPERESGYSFLGWSADSTATEAAFESGTELTINDTETLYAVWHRPETLVSGELNGLTWSINDDGLLEFSGTGAIEGKWASPEDVPWYSYRESIKAVYVPETVDAVGDYAFAGCTALETVVFPDTLKYLGAYAFSGCTALESITLPADLETLSEGAFAGCSALGELTLPAGLQTLAPSAFDGCTNLELIVPENSSFQTDHGALYTENGTKLLRYIGTEGTTSLRLPKEVTFIAENAFSGVTLTIEYPCTSTCDTTQNYGGTLTWVISHDYESETTPATCTEDGSIAYTCKDNSTHTQTTPIPATGHAYAETVTLPTCTAGGSTLHVCKNENCTDSYTDAETDPLGHDMVRGACTRCDYTEYSAALLNAPETLVSKKSISLKAELWPYNMTQTSLVWSIIDGAEYATLSSSGKLTAKAVTEQHTVTVRVEAKDGQAAPAECTVILLPKVTAVRILQGGEAVTGTTLSYNLRDENAEPIVLTADTLPMDATQKVTWTCSDRKSAYCRWELAEDGTLTITPSGTGKVGTVTFTAKATDGSGKKATVKVRFSYIAFAGDLSITNTVNRVTSGKKLKLTYAFTPCKPTVNKLVWSINPEDAAYASVSSSGVVTAKKYIGTAEDGSYHTVTVTAALKSDPSVKASVVLEIIPATTSVTIYTGAGEEAQPVSGTKLTASVGDTLQLTAAATPEAASQSFTWKSSSAKYATVTPDGKVTFHAKGTVKITATATDGTAKKATVTIVIQ